MVGMFRAELRELFGRAAVFEAAPGVHIGQHHRLLRRQDFRGLSHKANAAKGDHIGIRLRRLFRQIEAVADEIGQILYLGLLIIMREDHRIAFFAQAIDFGEQVHPVQASAHSLACVHLECISFTRHMASGCSAIKAEAIALPRYARPSRR